MWRKLEFGLEEAGMMVEEEESWMTNTEVVEEERRRLVEADRMEFVELEAAACWSWSTRDILHWNWFYWSGSPSWQPRLLEPRMRRRWSGS